MSSIETLSPKVLAAGAGAGGGATIGGLVLWLIGAGIFHGGWQADQAAHAVAAVPVPLSLFVMLVVSVVGAVWAGYAKVDPDRNGPLETAETFGSTAAERDEIDGWAADADSIEGVRNSEGNLVNPPDVGERA